MKDGLPLEWMGLEIGPAYSHVYAKKDGYNIRSLDVMTKGELVRHNSSDDKVNKYLDNIEDVDYVWHGEKYEDIIDQRFDYVIAANVIEHQIDLIYLGRLLQSGPF